MAVIYIISFVLTIILMPFFTHGQCFIHKYIFFSLSFLLTPFIGIPIYLYFMSH